MNDLFDDIFDHLLKWEGGYVFDPRDRGGETKYGISKRSYPALNIKALSRDNAKDIYFEDFWKPLHPEYGYPTACLIQAFDHGVNTGLSRGRKLLQATDDPALMFARRMDYYLKLRQFNIYGRGWSRRVVDTYRFALDYVETPSRIFVVSGNRDTEVPVSKVTVIGNKVYFKPTDKAA